ncbi:MAG: arsenite methyltransferase [Oligoflexales bacterium]|nr:arsenite methyltransferase [Oligoflexales bacterium]
MSKTKDDKIRSGVRDRYAGIANSQGSGCCGSGGKEGNSSGCGCSGSLCVTSESSAHLGYSQEEMQAVPDGANMGLGCGNPGAIASLKKGETVLDLGCGGGFDVFLAARQVGPEGKVIGVDMTPDMVSKARANAQKGGYENVDIRLGEIEHLPVADNSVDVIISNCVINLSPDKAAVFEDAYRVLRKNGRLAISDVIAIEPLTDEIKKNMDAYSGCVGGAALLADLQQMLKNAGFQEVRVEVKMDSDRFIKEWFPGSGIERYVRSANITAIKY